MDNKLSRFLYNVTTSREKISEDVIKEITDRSDFKFPEDYLDVIRELNEGEGKIGKNSRLILFPFEELEKINGEYDYLIKDIPDYFLFGKDAADTGYAFHKRAGTYHAFGLMSYFDTDPIIFCGNNFAEFAEYLNNR